MNILIIHQSAELYGSDKTMLQLAGGLISRGCTVVVLLPNDGPLKVSLQQLGVICVVGEVVKLNRGMMNFRGIMVMPFKLLKSISTIRRLVVRHEIDILHSNTLAVIGGCLYRSIFKIKHVWHVHEILADLKVINHLYGFLLRSYADEVICNSNATKRYLIDISLSNERSKVIYNGIDLDVSESSKINSKRMVGFQEADLVVGLVGRINDWKGHDLMMDAFESLDSRKRLKLLFVGSPPIGKDFYLDKLRRRIEISKVSECIRLIGFQDDMARIWKAIDICVIPSIKPEPFGMVAIEAMAHSIPVIAADHGGVSEIVIDNYTGYKFTPNSASSLACAIERLSDSVETISDFGRNSRARVCDNFPIMKYVNNIYDVYRDE